MGQVSPTSLHDFSSLNQAPISHLPSQVAEYAWIFAFTLEDPCHSSESLSEVSILLS